MKRLLLPATMMFALAVTAPSSAAPITFFGEDQGAGGSLPVPNSAAAEAAFLSNLVGVSTETFESFATGTSLGAGIVTNFGSDTATLTSTTGSIAGSPNVGTFAISGSKFVSSGLGGDLTLTFSNPQAAFGFYGTDIGDVSGQLTLILDGTRIINIPHTVNGNSGSGLFFGIIDTAQPFTTIQFNNAGANDLFGFDNFTIGRQEQVVDAVPEPSTLIVFGLMAAFGAVGCRRRGKATV